MKIELGLTKKDIFAALGLRRNALKKSDIILGLK